MIVSCEGSCELLSAHSGLGVSYAVSVACRTHPTASRLCTTVSVPASVESGGINATTLSADVRDELARGKTVRVMKRSQTTDNPHASPSKASLAQAYLLSAAYAALPVGPEGLAERGTPAADDIMAMVLMSVLFLS